MVAFISLISVFSILIFLVVNHEITKLENKNIKKTINAASEMGMSYINEAYIGEYEIVNNVLYKGENPLQGNNNLVDKVFQQTGASASIFRTDTIIATTIKDEENKRLNETKVSDKVSNIVLKQGKDFEDEDLIDGNIYVSKYIPIKDKNKKIVGMWFVGVDKSIITKTIQGIDLIIFLATLIVLIVADLTVNVFMNKILKNFNKVISSLAIISSGDLTTSCAVDSDDEIKDIADNINKMSDKMKVLFSLMENINQNYSFKEVLMFIYNKFSTFIPYEYIGIALIKEEGQVLEFSYGTSEGKFESLVQTLSGVRVNVNETSMREIIETGRTRIINNYSEHNKSRLINNYAEILMEAGINATITLPLIVNSKPVGIIFFASSNTNVYTQEHIQFLETISYSISISFEKCILLEDLIFSNIMSLVKLAELRDSNTGDHLERIKIYAKAIVRFLYEDSIYKNDISNEYINDIEKFAPIHDIGKVGIQDGILLKPGKLTIIEFEEMKKHTIYGGEVLKLAEKNSLSSGRSAFLIGIEIIEGHHEKWDGTGYPYSKKGTEIPLSARIVAVADVFDALTSKRPYKKAFSFEESFNIILEGKGKHFDPEIVRVFEKNKDTIEKIYNSYITDS